jgi:hypothetical protein
MTTFQQLLFGGSPSKQAAKPGKRNYRSRAVAASTLNWSPILIPGAVLDMDMFQVYMGKCNLSVKALLQRRIEDFVAFSGTCREHAHMCLLQQQINWWSFS